MKPINIINELSVDKGTQFRGKAQDAAKLFSQIINKSQEENKGSVIESEVYKIINAAANGFNDDEAQKIVDNIIKVLK